MVIEICKCTITEHLITKSFLTYFVALPKSPSRLSTANGPRTPLQPAKASGVIYSVPEPSSTPLPPRSPLKATPPKGIRGSTVSKNGRSPTQDANKREQSPGEHVIDLLQSSSRVRYGFCNGNEFLLGVATWKET